MVRQAMDFVTAFDPELGRMIEAEYKRQARNIELIASENIVSEAVMAAMGSVLTNKYAEGYPCKRYYGGCECVDEVENLAIRRVCQLFGAKYANVQPHSGAQANMVISWHRRSTRGCMENSLSSSTRTRRFASPCTGTRRIPAPRLPTICDENPSCWRNAAITFTSLRTVRSEHPSLPAK